ncbi:MAG: hypothetical protein ABIN94_12135 [Ferruginibacter sp.]
MKKQINTLFASISAATLKDLTTDVKETIANGFNHPVKKKFTAADLWNIQRQKRSTAIRNFSL